MQSKIVLFLKPSLFLFVHMWLWQGNLALVFRVGRTRNPVRFWICRRVAVCFSRDFEVPLLLRKTNRAGSALQKKILRLCRCHARQVVIQVSNSQAFLKVMTRGQSALFGEKECYKCGILIHGQHKGWRRRGASKITHIFRLSISFISYSIQCFCALSNCYSQGLFTAHLRIQFSVHANFYNNVKAQLLQQ